MLAQNWQKYTLSLGRGQPQIRPRKIPEYRYTVAETYTHDRRADKYPYSHDCRADKDSYPHDRNVTDLCSLIKLCFAFIMVNFST